ncbi:hypothetical protein BAUCODRAFT_113538 [Baudoinia panamericana UAMH 10762]|uniref:Signal recognition particle receptor subunit beta n=1 Tax=Baudoinia panamericana (strain UAMH 10762) TaxID=717646 RepID=M2N2W6_BAUPA|nr:uncharacterized protein BAUCODRAFT_113538 [Baudoinia panamericana UAMH 10762]EMC93324.1 hypothetical protein BAUCODRAFT_113538 [Baudoinia panamericana UAMH 10762]
MASSSTAKDWLTWAFSPAISAIFATLLISLTLPLLIHFYLYRKAVAKELPTFLLIGPSGAGKTTLLTLFANGSPSPTHTSQEPQSAVCQLPSSARSSEDRYRSENDTSAQAQPKLALLDTPGHGKLRHHATSSLTTGSSLKGLIFVVDSAAVSSAAGLTEAAEYLHDVLLLLQKRHTQSKTSKDPQAIPVLVAANKQDVFTSLPAGLVRTKLEEEIAKVRRTRSKGLLDSGIGMDEGAGGDEETNWLGEYGTTDFKFSQMGEHGVEVSVRGGNAKGDGGESGKVNQWWEWVGGNI